MLKRALTICKNIAASVLLASWVGGALASTAATPKAAELVVLNVYQALYGAAPGHADFVSYTTQATANPNVWANSMAASFAGLDNTSFSTKILTHFNINASTVNQAALDAMVPAVAGYLNSVGLASRGTAIGDLGKQLTSLANDGTFGVAASGFNTQIAANYSYSANASNTASATISVPSPGANELVVLHVFQALYGYAPGHADFVNYVAQAAANPSAWSNAYAANFVSLDGTRFATQVLNNFNISATTMGRASWDALMPAVAAYFEGVSAESRGVGLLQLGQLLSGLVGDGTYGVAAVGFRNQISTNYRYSTHTANTVASTVADSASGLQSMRAPAPPQAAPMLTAQDIVGSYRDVSQPGTTWWSGSITFKPDSTSQLLWSNTAGVTWTLSRTVASNVWAVDAESAHPEGANATSFNFTVQAGKVVGLSFFGNFLTREGAKPQLLTPSLSTYLHLDVDKAAVPPGSTYGYSMYTAIWPMIDQPLFGFQVGTVGTWLNADNLDYTQALVPTDHPFRNAAPFMEPYWRGFQTIEGSPGYWSSTRFPSTQAKYRINGTPNGYSNQLSAPGWEFGGNAIAPGAGYKWTQPMGSAGVAQLSNRLLMPPDGLTFKNGTAGEFFGIAWMALPLTPAKGGSNPVGNQSWTFFANATNFKGPVAFYVPDVWEVLASTHAPAVGRGLDARPGVFAAGFAMEMGRIPFMRSTDSRGNTYGRLPRLSFPTDANNRSYLASDFAFYSNAALFAPLQTWLDGGAPISEQFAAAGTVKLNVSAQTIYMWSGDGATRVQMQSSEGLSDYVVPTAVTTAGGGSAWALQWKGSASQGIYPEYYQNINGFMRPIAATQVPEDTGLKAAVFPYYTDVQAKGAAYTSPATWSSPAPVAGPFSAQLVDGSTVTYAWYRFMDQPSLQGFGWTADQKNKLQAVVEKIHTQWSGTTQFMAPHTAGELVSLDAALIVVPPAGLEVGYVPIVISQRK